MELLLLLLLLISTPIIFFLSLKLLYYSKPKKCSNLPPGKMGWPFLGETLEFISAGRNGTPENFFHDRLNRHSPEIFKTSLIAEKVAVLGGAAGNKFLFTNENKLVKAWYPRNVEKIFPSSLELSQSDETTKMRKFLPGHLQLREYVGVMDAIAKQHLDSHWDLEGGEITVLPLAKRFAFAVACRLFLSIDDPDHIARLEKPFHAVMGGVSSLPINFPGTKFSRAIGAASLIRKELTKIIRHRKSEREMVGRRRDILDHMLTAPGEDGRFMSEPDIADKIIGFLLAGTDSSSSVITFVVNYLADLPQIYDKVFKEQREIAIGGETLKWGDLEKMKYSWNVACEVLRLAPPIQAAFREATADFTYAGFSIPKGWKIYWTPNSTHKNPEYFEEAEKFDPSRFEGKWPIPYSYVPFGGGTRLCPGKEYARILILVFMHNLVTNFTWEKVLPQEKVVVEHMPMPANGLPVRMHRRTRSKPTTPTL